MREEREKRNEKSECLDEHAVRAALSGIMDPCSIAAHCPASLEDMGLLREVRVMHSSTGTHVHVTLGLTEPGCLMSAPFMVSVRETLERIPGVTAVSVDVDHDFDWWPEHMSPEYRAKLEAKQQLERERWGVPLPMA